MDKVGVERQGVVEDEGSVHSSGLGVAIEVDREVVGKGVHERKWRKIAQSGGCFHGGGLCS